MENSSNSTLSGPTKHDERLKDIVEGVFIVCIAVVAVIGNTLIILVIYRNRNLWALRNLFIASLSFSDLCMACTDILYQAIGKLVPNYKPPHYSICYLILLCGVLFGSSSVFNLTAMTLNRYIAISYPLHYSQYVTQKRSAMILALVWLASFCLALPPLLWRPVEVVCYSTTPSNEHLVNEIVYMAVELVFWFGIPALIIVISYCRIYRIAKSQARQIAAMETSQRNAVAVGTSNGRTMNSKVRISTYKERKAGKMVTILISFWLFCWLPFFTVLAVHKFHSSVPPILMSIFLELMFMNSAVNPILLTLHNREMKVAIRRLIRKSPLPNNDVEMQTSARRSNHSHVNSSVHEP